MSQGPLAGVGGAPSAVSSEPLVPPEPGRPPEPGAPPLDLVPPSFPPEPVLPPAAGLPPPVASADALASPLRAAPADALASPIRVAPPNAPFAPAPAPPSASVPPPPAPAAPPLAFMPPGAPAPAGAGGTSRGGRPARSGTRLPPDPWNCPACPKSRRASHDQRRNGDPPATAELHDVFLRRRYGRRCRCLFGDWQNDRSLFSHRCRLGRHRYVRCGIGANDSVKSVPIRVFVKRIGARGKSS